VVCMSKVLDLLMTFASNMKSGVLSLFPHVQECKVILAVYITIMWHSVWPLFDASSVIITPELQGSLQPVHK